MTVGKYLLWKNTLFLADLSVWCGTNAAQVEQTADEQLEYGCFLSLQSLSTQGGGAKGDATLGISKMQLCVQYIKPDKHLNQL